MLKNQAEQNLEGKMGAPTGLLYVVTAASLYVTSVVSFMAQGEFLYKNEVLYQGLRALGIGALIFGSLALAGYGRSVWRNRRRA